MSFADDLLAQSRAYQQSRIILTAASLDLFTKISARPSGAEEIAAAAQTDPRATRRLLDALMVLGLLKTEGGAYHVTESGALLSSAHPESLLPMVLHGNRMWEGWTHLTEVIKTGRNLHYGPPHKQSWEVLKAFIEAMHVIGRGLSEEIAASLDLTPYRRLLDVGGGSGTYTVAFLRRNPKMTAVIFDMGDVLALAEKRMKDEGLSDRVSLVPGDFYENELPRGCDLALLSAIIHQNSPEENVTLFRKVHRALEPGGTLLIRDHVMDETRTRPAFGALFALNMLVATPAGDTYTYPEIESALKAGGFASIRLLRQGERMDALVEARKP